MRAVVQRVSEASVRIDGGAVPGADSDDGSVEVGRIGRGYLVLLAAGQHDTAETARQFATKISGLRLFQGDDGRMNLSLADVEGTVLCVSQFTLYGDVRRGRRPSFKDALEPSEAARLYDLFCETLETHGIRCARGRFGARMAVSLVNDGPVTLMLDSADLERPRRA